MTKRAVEDVCWSDHNLRAMNPELYGQEPLGFSSYRTSIQSLEDSDQQIYTERTTCAECERDLTGFEECDIGLCFSCRM